MTSIEQIYKILEESKADFVKGHTGVKAAGTRGRNALSEVSKLCKEARKELLAASKGERNDTINL